MAGIEEMIKVMQAYLNGMTIQQKMKGENNWYCEDKPRWNWAHFDYRVKPQPREWWLNIYRRGGPVIHETREAADCAASPGLAECVRVREVLDTEREK